MEGATGTWAAGGGVVDGKGEGCWEGLEESTGLWCLRFHCEFGVVCWGEGLGGDDEMMSLYGRCLMEEWRRKTITLWILCWDGQSFEIQPMRRRHPVSGSTHVFLFSVAQYIFDVCRDNETDTTELF